MLQFQILLIQNQQFVFVGDIYRLLHICGTRDIRNRYHWLTMEQVWVYLVVNCDTKKYHQRMFTKMTNHPSNSTIDYLIHQDHTCSIWGTQMSFSI